MTAATHPAETTEPAREPSDPPAPGRDGWLAAVAGVAAAAAALSLSELVAGIVSGVPSLVVAVGNAVVDIGAGSRVKEIAIALFGTNEKTALLVGTVVLSLVFGAGLGILSRRTSWLAGAAGFVGFAILGVVATLASPLDNTALALVPALLSAGIGTATLRWLLDYSRGIDRATDRGLAGRGRRDFLRITLGLTVVSGAVGALGRSLSSRAVASLGRAAVVLPSVNSTAPAAPPGAAFADIDGLSPLFTPNDGFYRIDTALTTPMVDVEGWSLRLHGLVEQEVTLTYDELLALPQVEADVTIACVSNEVGGDLIGNARWQGVRLSSVLDLAGVDPSTATQLVGRSVDGWTAGFPTDIAFDGRDAMIALAMNGEPLPLAHGFPARLIVPGLYGYVSATKWLSEIELTTWEAFDGYWVPRGWSKEGPVKTQSRIDVPARGAQVAPGRQVIAGVAWAQHRGVEQVEVSIDDGPWEVADLAEALNIDTWRQWRLAWDAVPGEHQIRVRATDGDGVTQSAAPVPVAPNGAEGLHTRVVRVA